MFSLEIERLCWINLCIILWILVDCSVAEEADPGLLVVEVAEPGLVGAAEAAEKAAAALAVVLPAAAPQAQLVELFPAKIILKPKSVSQVSSWNPPGKICTFSLETLLAWHPLDYHSLLTTSCFLRQLWLSR